MGRGVLSLTTPYTYYHGFNEAFYYLVSQGPAPFWTPQILGAPFYHTPPLYPSMVAVGDMFPPHAASRLPSLIAYAGLSLILYSRGKLLWAVTPWLLLWMGRGQTDPLLTFFVVLLAWARQENKPGIGALAWGLGLMSKQTMFLAFPLLLFWPAYGRWSAWLYSYLASGLVLGWWLLSYYHSSAGVLEAWRFHSEIRTQPFEAWLEVAFLGLLLGSAGLPWWRSSRWRAPETLTCFLLILFSLWQSPWGHSYYVLPAIGLAAFMLPPPRQLHLHRNRLLVLLQVAVGVFLLADAGDLGPPVLRRAVDETPQGAWTQAEWWPQALVWGVRTSHEGLGCYATGGRDYLCKQAPPGCDVTRVWRWMSNQIILGHCPPETGGQET